MSAPEEQIERLAAYILMHVPGESLQNEGAVDTAIRLLEAWVEVPRKGEKWWTCKIGPAAPGELPDGADFPMRHVAKNEFYRLTGHEPAHCFSGWGAHLTEGERSATKDL